MVNASCPTSAGRGPWDPKSHARPDRRRLARPGDRATARRRRLHAVAADGRHVSPAGFLAVDVQTRIVRDGKRIKVIDAEFFSGGVSMARATSQLLLRTENPPGKVWSRPDWNAPRTRRYSAPTEHARRHERHVGDAADRGHDGHARARARSGSARCASWSDGVPLTPFTRVAVSADFTSPFANAGDQGLRYINTDVTVYLHRAAGDGMDRLRGDGSRRDRRRGDRASVASTTSTATSAPRASRRWRRKSRPRPCRRSRRRCRK